MTDRRRARSDDARVPDHRAILDSDVLPGAEHARKLLDSVRKRALRTEDGSIVLHRLLHVEPDLARVLGSIARSDLVQTLDAVHTGILRDLLVGHAGLEVRGNVVGAGATKDDDVEEGVGSETVGTVDGNAGGLTSGVESRNDDVVAVLRSQNSLDWKGSKRASGEDVQRRR